MSFQRQSTSPIRGHRKNCTGGTTIYSQLLKTSKIPECSQCHVSKPILRLSCTMGRWEDLSIFISLSACTCLCTFSCGCSSDVCFFFPLFLSLYYTNPGSALFFSRDSIHTACKQNLTTRFNKWDLERKKEEGKERKKLQKRNQLTICS